MLVECANGVIETPDLEHGLEFMQNEDSIMITFPDHIQAEIKSAGIIVPIKELLHWHADGYSPEQTASAQKLREIADRCYTIPEDEGDVALGDLITPDVLRDIEAMTREF